MNNNTPFPNNAYLSPEWRKEMRERFGSFLGDSAEKYRKPNKKVGLSEWLNKNQLKLNIRGEEVTFTGPMEDGKYYLLLNSICSGGAYRVITATTTVPCTDNTQKNEDKARANTEKKGSINTIITGLTELVKTLNSSDAEYLHLLCYHGPEDKPKPIVADPDRKAGKIRYSDWPNTERWTTEIFLDPQNLEAEIAGCIKAIIGAGHQFDIAGMSKYIPNLHDILDLPQVERNPDLIVGDWVEEYGLNTPDLD